MNKWAIIIPAILVVAVVVGFFASSMSNDLSEMVAGPLGLSTSDPQVQNEMDIQQIRDQGINLGDGSYEMNNDDLAGMNIDDEFIINQTDNTTIIDLALAEEELIRYDGMEYKNKKTNFIQDELKIEYTADKGYTISSTYLGMETDMGANFADATPSFGIKSNGKIKYKPAITHSCNNNKDAPYIEYESLENGLREYTIVPDACGLPNGNSDSVLQIKSEVTLSGEEIELVPFVDETGNIYEIRLQNVNKSLILAKLPKPITTDSEDRIIEGWYDLEEIDSGEDYKTYSIIKNFEYKEISKLSYPILIDPSFYELIDESYSVLGSHGLTMVQSLAPYGGGNQVKYFAVLYGTSDQIRLYDSSFDFQDTVTVAENDPRGLAWNGSHYSVVGRVDHEIVTYDEDLVATGSSYDISSECTNTYGLTWNGSSYLLLCQGASDIIYEYNSTYNYTGTSYNITNTTYSFPTSLTYDGTYYWIPDLAASPQAVRKFNSSFDVIATYDEPDAFDANGAAYDPWSNTLWRLDNDEIIPRTGYVPVVENVTLPSEVPEGGDIDLTSFDFGGYTGYNNTSLGESQALFFEEDSSVIDYFPLDGHGTGTSGNGDHYDIRRVAGQFSSLASDFDGSTSYVDTETSYSTTFDGSFTMTGWVKPDQYLDNDVTFFASYENDIDGDFGAGNLTGTASGGASVENGLLSLNYSDIRYVDYDADLQADMQQVGAIRFKVTPNYSGTPAGSYVFLIITEADSNTDNEVNIFHQAGTGNLRINVRDQTGTTTATADGVWSPTAGQEYEVYAHWDLTTGDTRIFVDGTQLGIDTATGTRDANIGLLRVGSNNNRITNSNFFLRDLTIYDTIQHTSNYTVGEHEEVLFGTEDANDKIKAHILPHGKLEVQYESGGNEAVARTNDSIFVGGGADNWTHVALVADSTVGDVGGLKIYVDNVEQTLHSDYDGNTSGITFSSYSNTDELFIGSYDNAGTAEGYFDGAIDEFYIFNDVLNSTERTDVYNDDYMIKSRTMQPYAYYDFELDFLDNSIDSTTRLDGQTNNNVDFSSNAHSGQYSAYFDGSPNNEYIEIGYGTELYDLCTNGCSFSTWLDRDASSGTIASRFGASDVNSFFRFRISSNNLIFEISEAGNYSELCTATSTGGPIGGGYKHAVAVYNTTDIMLYADNVLVANTTCGFTGINETAWNTSQDTAIGAEVYGTIPGEYEGDLDDFYIFNRNISTDEIDALYDQKLRSDITITAGNTYKALVSATDGWHTVAGLSNTATGNAAPVVNTVDLTPVSPYTDDDLNCTANATDDDDVESFTYNFTWYKNGALNSSYTQSGGEISSYILTSGNTTKNENWTCEVHVNNTLVSNYLNSSQVTILNSAPVISDISVTPGSPLTANDLTCTITATDADGDTPLTYNYQWYVDDVANESDSHTSNTDILGNGNTSEAEVWRCEGNVSDGTDTSTNNVSNNVTIGNTAPVLNTVTLTPGTAYTTTNLTCEAGATDADPLDTLTYNFYFNKNGALNYSVLGSASNTSILNSSVTTKNDIWNCTVNVSDEAATSNTLSSANVTILNSAPVLSALNLYISSPPGDACYDPSLSLGDTLYANVTYTDADGDVPNVHLEYLNIDDAVSLKNQTFAATSYGNYTTVSTDELDYINVTAYLNDTDGGISSTLYNDSNRVQVLFRILNTTNVDNDPTASLLNETYTIDVMYDPLEVSNIESDIIYNSEAEVAGSLGTPVAWQGQENVTVTYNRIVPFVTTQTVFDYNYTFDYDDLDGGAVSCSNSSITGVLSDTFNQTVEAGLGTCGGAFTQEVMKLFLRNETANTSATGNIDITLRSNVSGTTANYTFTCSSCTNLTICSTTNDTINYDTQIEYSAANFEVENYYHYQLPLTGTTRYDQYLHDLQTTLSTTYKVTVEDTDFTSYENAFVRLLRYYPGTDEYRIVEIGKTDSDGVTLIHAVDEDVIYQFHVYDGASSVYESTDTKMPGCSAEPCEFDISLASSTFGSPVNYASGSYISDITYSGSFNPTSKIYTLNYTDTSGSLSLMRLQVKSYGIISVDEILCDTNSTNSSGSLTCNLTGEYGSFKARALLSRSPARLLPLLSGTNLTTVFDIPDSEFDFGGDTSVEGLLLSILIILGVTMVALYQSPSTAIVAMLFTIGGLGFIGLLKISTAALLTIIGVGVFVFWLISKNG